MDRHIIHCGLTAPHPMTPPLLFLLLLPLASSLKVLQPSSSLSPSPHTPTSTHTSIMSRPNQLPSPPPHHLADTVSPDYIASAKLRPNAPHTPPESPQAAQAALNLPDPALYSHHVSSSPLFSPHDSPPTTSCAPAPAFLEPAAPTSPNILPYPACLAIHSPADALHYWHTRVDELTHLNHLRARNQLPLPSRQLSTRRLDDLSRRQLSRLSKPRSAALGPPGSPKSPLGSKPLFSSKLALVPRRNKPRPHPRAKPQPTDSTTTAAAEPKNKRAPPSKTAPDAHLTWRDLPDYCPPLTTLASSLAQLHVTWRGTPLDLTADPDLRHLHQQEFAVASRLRLSAAAYLTNKRKIFAARVRTLHTGGPTAAFGKTAAQNACGIDVNKASQLWEAFDRVGWFGVEHFEGFRL